ncbi:N-6 DNA methylase [Microscilla marina]|uniref:site-specific DNA-methyltransferase (adenine-specific) n=1 Tax=Microscilla marina ATCC 23134 TaxID=313606 RepID=A1ZTJ1_MICM2|nr:N-6 DNA methylase [Microscilla marina]EAY26251.1 hypothetical protein M23134_01573 [Microscilla marina ATCC 23134]
MKQSKKTKLLQEFEELSQKQSNEYIGLQLFLLVWAQAGKRLKLPKNLDIMPFLRGMYSTIEELKEVADKLGAHLGIDQAVPFRNLLNLSKRFVDAEAIAHWRSIINRLWQRPAPPEDWQQIYVQVVNQYLTHPSATDGWGDPVGFNQLLATLAARLSPELRSLYCPFAYGNGIALALHQQKPSTSRELWALDQVTDAHLISQCTAFVMGWQNTHLDIGPFLRVKDYALTPVDTVLGILPVRKQHPHSLVSELLPYIKQARMSALVTSAAILYKGSPRNEYEVANLRIELLKSGMLRAIVALPSNQKFYSRIKMVMLVFDTSQRFDEVVVINAEHINQAKTRYKTLETEDIEKIVNTIEQRKEVEFFSKVYKNEQLYDAHMGMNIAALVPAKATKEELKSLEELAQEEQTLKTRLAELRGTLDNNIGDLLDL